VCLAAYDGGQAARDERRLVKARDQFAICASDACPAALRGDCITWLREADEILPSIVLRAVDEGGRDETRLDVNLDGVGLEHALDGRAIRIDPGPHTLRLTGPGYEGIEEKLVVAEGEKDRVLVVHLKRLGPAPNIARPPEEPAPRRGSLVLPIVLGAGAVLAFGGATFFYVRGIHDGNELRSTCGSPPRCAQSDADAAHSKLVVGDIFAGIGIVAAAVAAYLVVTRPSTSRATASF
jgi:hypothetical protein